MCRRRRLRWVRWCRRWQVSVGLGVSPLRGAGPLRCASSHRGTDVSTLTGCRPSRNTVRPAGPAWPRGGPFPCPGKSGPCFLHAARERGPLGELTGLQVAALGAAPARSPPLSPAMPAAGPLNVAFSEEPAAAAPLPSQRSAAAPLQSQRSAARPPRQSLAFGSLGGTSAARGAAVRHRSVGCAATAAPGGAGTSSATLRRPWEGRGKGSPCASRPTGLPPAAPPSVSEGDLLGGSTSGGPGNWLTASAAEEPHPSPTPSP
jgi:hypothetical protein